MLQTLASQWAFIPEVDYWYISRAAGIVAFLFLWGSVFTGILMKVKSINQLAGYICRIESINKILLKTIVQA